MRIPRDIGKTRDITGGLPRVTELFEARSPSDPAVVFEIDGAVSFGAQKRGAREIDRYEPRRRTSEVPHLAREARARAEQRHASVRASGCPTVRSIRMTCLRIKGVGAVQEYLVNEIQEVYRIQGVKINDKHIETIVRQMMQKLRIAESGDTKFLEGDFVDKLVFEEENESLRDKVFVKDKGDSSKVKNGQLITLKKFRGIEPGPEEAGQEGHREARTGSGNVGAGAARHHIRGVVDRQLHLGGLVPGDDEGADGCGDRGQDGLPAWPEGKRDYGPFDPCGHRVEEVRGSGGTADG